MPVNKRFGFSNPVIPFEIRDHNCINRDLIIESSQDQEVRGRIIGEPFQASHQFVSSLVIESISFDMLQCWIVSEGFCQRLQVGSTIPDRHHFS